MNNILLSITKIIIYLLLVILIYYVAKITEKKDKDREKKIKFPVIAILIFATFMGCYSLICGPTDDIGDRYHYAIKFENEGYASSVKKSSLGLYVIEEIIHLFSNDANTLFFIISFLYFIAVLVAYKTIDNTTPLSLLLLLLSTCGLFSFYALKQSLAIGFILLSYSSYKNKKWAFLVLCVLLAIMCHEAALIAPLAFIVAKIVKNERRTIILSILLMLGVIFFKQISDMVINIVSLFPSLKFQIANYINEDGSLIIKYNFATALKGLPIYSILTLAWINRHALNKKINNFYCKFTITLFCAYSILTSVYMYWNFRFGLFFLFPIFIFLSEILQYFPEKKQKRTSIIIVLMCAALIIKTLIQYYFIYGGIV